MNCRIGCGACCIAPSISSPLPGMPHGKPAGARCIHLTDGNRCRIWGHPIYPKVCQQFRPSPEVCGASAAEALALLARLESETTPDA